MAYHDKMKIILRTTKVSGTPIDDHVQAIVAAIGRNNMEGIRLLPDARRESQCVLVLPDHYCAVRARSTMNRLLGSVRVDGDPVLEATLEGPGNRVKLTPPLSPHRN